MCGGGWRPETGTAASTRGPSGVRTTDSACRGQCLPGQCSSNAWARRPGQNGSSSVRNTEESSPGGRAPAQRDRRVPRRPPSPAPGRPGSAAGDGGRTGRPYIFPGLPHHGRQVVVPVRGDARWCRAYDAALCSAHTIGWACRRVDRQRGRGPRAVLAVAPRTRLRRVLSLTPRPGGGAPLRARRTAASGPARLPEHQGTPACTAPPCSASGRPWSSRSSPCSRCRRAPGARPQTPRPPAVPARRPPAPRLPSCASATSRTSPTPPR